MDFVWDSVDIMWNSVDILWDSGDIMWIFWGYYMWASGDIIGIIMQDNNIYKAIKVC